MNRPYNINYYKNKIKKIREAVPKIALTTDIIVGFPGEEEEKFEKTFDFVKKIKYSRLHVFPFSAHEKTPASKLKNKIKREIILKRSARLRKLGKILEKQYKNKFIGKELDIMIEKIFKDKIKGKTEYYFDVEIPKKKLKANQIKKVAGKIIKIRL